MQQRKIFTMSKSMIMNPVQKSLLWIKNRKRYGIAMKDVVLAMVKSRRMKYSG